MAHHVAQSAYRRLQQRLDLFPQGAPPGPLIEKILALLMDEREAALVAQLPLRPFTARRAAAAWKIAVPAAEAVLDELAGRALLLDIEQGDEKLYLLPPPMAGFFEFALMRVRDDVDQRLLSELFWQYLNVEDDFIRALFANGETQLGRAFVQEPALPAAAALRVLDHERATEVVRRAKAIAVGLCYCRHKMQHLGRACDAPLPICMTFNTTAASLARHGVARRVDAAECLDLLQQAWDRGLVQFGENVQRDVNFICNCCGCCCEALLAAKKFAAMHPIHTTNWTPRVGTDDCTGCGACARACPMDALAEDDDGPPALDATRCLGCGVCVGACPTGAMHLVERAERVITPVDSAHRIVTMAIERGKLQNLLFDQQALASHRVMATILGALLRLPPAKRLLASRQFKSRYLGALFERFAAGAGADDRRRGEVSGNLRT